MNRDMIMPHLLSEGSLRIMAARQHLDYETGNIRGKVVLRGKTCSYDLFTFQRCSGDYLHLDLE
jgi:hypothetical protein